MSELPLTSSLSEFQLNSQSHVERLQATGLPEVLTIEGEPAIVVQSAAAYEALVRQANLAETLTAIREGLAQHERGETVPMREALEGLAGKYGVSL